MSWYADGDTDWLPKAWVGKIMSETMYAVNEREVLGGRGASIDGIACRWKDLEEEAASTGYSGNAPHFEQLIRWPTTNSEVIIRKTQVSSTQELDQQFVVPDKSFPVEDDYVGEPVDSNVMIQALYWLAGWLGPHGPWGESPQSTDILSSYALQYSPSWKGFHTDYFIGLERSPDQFYLFNWGAASIPVTRHTLWDSVKSSSYENLSSFESEEAGYTDVVYASPAQFSALQTYPGLRYSPIRVLVGNQSYADWEPQTRSFNLHKALEYHTHFLWVVNPKLKGFDKEQRFWNAEVGYGRVSRRNPWPDWDTWECGDGPETAVAAITATDVDNVIAASATYTRPSDPYVDPESWPFYWTYADFSLDTGNAKKVYILPGEWGIDGNYGSKPPLFYTGPELTSGEVSYPHFVEEYQKFVCMFDQDILRLGRYDPAPDCQFGGSSVYGPKKGEPWDSYNTVSPWAWRFATNIQLRYTWLQDMAIDESYIPGTYESRGVYRYMLPPPIWSQYQDLIDTCNENYYKVGLVMGEVGYTVQAGTGSFDLTTLDYAYPDVIGMDMCGQDDCLDSARPVFTTPDGWSNLIHWLYMFPDISDAVTNAAPTNTFLLSGNWGGLPATGAKFEVSYSSSILNGADNPDDCMSTSLDYKDWYLHKAFVSENSLMHYGGRSYPLNFSYPWVTQLPYVNFPGYLGLKEHHLGEESNVQSLWTPRFDCDRYTSNYWRRNPWYGNESSTPGVLWDDYGIGTGNTSASIRGLFGNDNRLRGFYSVQEGLNSYLADDSIRIDSDIMTMQPLARGVHAVTRSSYNSRCPNHILVDIRPHLTYG